MRALSLVLIVGLMACVHSAPKISPLVPADQFTLPLSLPGTWKFCVEEPSALIEDAVICFGTIDELRWFLKSLRRTEAPTAHAIAFQIDKPPPVKRTIIAPDAEYVCAPYQHGRSCLPASQVREYILHEGREACGESK